MAQRGWTPSGGSTGSGSLCSHVSPTSSQAGGGARWAMLSASVLNDLWPVSEVRESLGEGMSEGLDSWAEERGASVCTPVSRLVPGRGIIIILSVVPKGKSDLIGN